MADFLKLGAFKLLYGMDIKLGQFYETRGFSWIPDAFIKNHVERVINDEERDGIEKGYDADRFRVFDAGNYKVIYFDDSPVESGMVPDAKVFKNELRGIFNLLCAHYPADRIAVKYHPGYSGDDYLAGKYEIIPSYIPAELLYHDAVQIYLSVFSRSIAHVEKGLAVSIAYLITFKGNEYRDEIRADTDLVSKSKILYPKSLDELERIILNLQG